MKLRLNDSGYVDGGCKQDASKTAEWFFNASREGKKESGKKKSFFGFVERGERNDRGFSRGISLPWTRKEAPRNNKRILLGIASKNSNISNIFLCK